MVDTIATIEAYLTGKLTEEEHHAFAERLAKEPELMAQVQQFEDSRALLEQAVSLRLKKQMQQMQRPNVKPMRRLRLRWSAVAVMALLLMVAGIWYANRSANSYEKHFEPYALASGLRGETNGDDSWPIAYEQKEFEQAKKILANIAHDETGWVEAQFYLGNIALAQQKPSEAIGPLAAVIDVQSARFQASAEWYLVLAYWGSGDKRSAKQLAQTILNNGQHPYSAKVNRLLPYLDE